MAVPTLRTAAAKDAGTTVATAVNSVSGLAVGDLEMLIFAANPGGTLSISNNGGGAWSTVFSPVSVASGCTLHWWYRINATGDSNPSLISTAEAWCGFHTAVQVGTFNQGNPFEAVATGTETTSDTSYSFAPGTSTGGVDRVILNAYTILRDSNTASTPVCTNASLTSLASHFNGCTAVGLGAGIGSTSGVLSSAGGLGTFACTYAAVSPKSMAAVAINPSQAPPFVPRFRGQRRHRLTR